MKLFNICFIALLTLGICATTYQKGFSDDCCFDEYTSDVCCDSIEPSCGAVCNGGLFNNYCIEDKIWLEGTSGRTVGLHKGYGTLGYFASLNNPSSSLLPFIDLRGYYINKNVWASSTGAGLRWITEDCCCCRAWGVNFFYDYLKEYHARFNQIGIGVESLGCLWDFRINGYLPVGCRNQKIQTCVFDDFIGDFIMIKHRRGSSLRGVDAEVGLHLGHLREFSFYAAAGPYYYKNPGEHEIIGGRFYAQAWWKDLIKMEVRVTSDKVFHTRVQGIIAIEIPFDYLWPCGCQCPPDCCRKLFLTRIVERNPIIATRDHCCWVTNF